MFLALGIALYTSRVVLNILGVVDYGIYNVVGGVVSVFTIITATLAGSTQRFLSLELGKKQNSRVSETFNMFLTLHVIIAVVVFLLCETFGYYFLFKNLVIPRERVQAASLVYHFSILTFIFSIIKAPYDACLVAKENMKIYAYLGIIDVLSKLIIVYILKVILYDHLVVYSILLFLTTMLITITSIIYIYKSYSEFKFYFFWDATLFKTISKYIGWNYLTAIGDVARFQGVNILLNLFFGPTVNAARGIAFQVQTNVINFVRNFQTSVSPQLVKSYALNDYMQMINLMTKTCKISFAIMLFLVAPILANCEYLLTIWLGKLPKYTTLFCQLVLIQSLLECIAYPLWTVIGAIGKLKFSHLVGSLLYLLIPLTTYISLKYGAEPQITFFISIIIMILMLQMLIYRINKLVPGYLKILISNILIIPLILSIIISFSILLCINTMQPMIFSTFIKSGLVITSFNLVSFFGIVLNKTDRKNVLVYFKSKF